MMNHTFRARVTILLLASGLALSGCHRKSAVAEEPQSPEGEVWLTPHQARDAKVIVEQATEHEVEDTILTSGAIALDDLGPGHVLSPVTGRVVSVAAGLGQRVKKGDPLAIIESPDVGGAMSDIHKAEADLCAAERDLKRKNLEEQSAGPAADVDAANGPYRNAKAELERAGEREGLLGRGAADGAAQRFTLTSPVDGEILVQNVSPGVEVRSMYGSGANVELFTIGKLDKVWVLGDLDEADFRRVHRGAPASVRVVAHPDKVFHGVVDWVSGALDPNTRTAKVHCTFDNREKLLRPMTYATVHISVEQTRALAIPRNALLRLGNDKIVFVQTGEDGRHVRFKPVAVDVEESGESPWLVVRKGLQLGSKIVVRGGMLLAELRRGREHV